MEPAINQHLTDPQLLTHVGREVTRYDYNTVYSDNYRGCQSSQPAVCCRSYPRQYPDASERPRPDQTGCLPPITEGDTRPCRETRELMAATGTPFVRDTSGGDWKYSYHGLPRCYPGGFSRIDPDNPYPGFYLRPNKYSNTAGGCDVTT